MVNRLLAIVMLFACLVWPGSAVAGVTLKVGYFENPPVFFSEDGIPQGIAFDILKELADKNGWSLKTELVPRNQIVEMLEAGQLDVVPGLPFSYRHPTIRYTSDSLVSDWATVYINSGTADNVQDLAGYHIGYVYGDPRADVFKYMAGRLGVPITLVRYDTYMNVLEAVDGGKVQAGIVGRLFGLRYGETFGVKPSNILFDPVSLRIAVSAKTSEAIYDALEKGLGELKKDRSSIYFASLAERLKSEPSIMRWITPMTLVVVAAVILCQLVAFFWFKRRLADTTSKADRQEEALKKETRVRKRAQGALWESVERHRAMFTDNRLPQLLVDGDSFRILEANPAAERYYGYPPGELSSMFLYDISASDPVVMQGVLADVKQGRGNVVSRHRLSGGRLKDVELFISQLYVHEQQQLLVTVVDISERVAAESARTASEERLDLAVKGGDLAFWDWDVENDSFLFSDHYAVMLGTSPRALGPTMEDLLSRVHPDDYEQVLADFQNCLDAEDGGHHVQFRVRTSSGELRWIMSQGRVSQYTTSGRPLRVTGIAYDITERKQTQDRLTAINDTFLKFSPAPDENIAALTDLLGRELDGCSSFYSRVSRMVLTPHSMWSIEDEEFLYAEIGPGHLSHELMGRNVNGLYLINNLQSSQFAATDPDVPRLGLETYIGQIIRVDGRQVGVLCVLFKDNYTPTESDEMIFGIVAAALAIEEERNIAAEALVKAKEEAETANRAKSEFLANMSHEIRTPLNGIFGMLQLVGETELDHEQSDFISTALTSGRSLLRVINDVLDFSKMEAGMLTLENEPFDFRQMVKSVLDNFTVQAGEKELDLILEIDKAVPRVVSGDEARLRQILFNLVGNGVKFTRTGSVRVESWVVPRRKDVRKTRLYMRVQDTGIGIPDHMQTSVFNAFSQVDGSYTREYGGTGLGLGIVQRLVGLMGGEISVESSSNGTSIYFFVDVTEVPDADTDIIRPVSPSVKIAPLNILLVEDERVNRMVVKKHLERLGHTVNEVSDGKKAIDLLKWNDFDAVLMDIQMPNMDGITASRIIREDPGLADRAEIPIIALTAHAMKGDRDKFLAAGMNDYLAKPVELADLVEVLSRVSSSR